MAMDHPKISIITTVYKTGHYLPLTVQSILAQTFTDFELLLVDDGSPDNSGEVADALAKTDARIRVFHKENGPRPQHRAGQRPRRLHRICRFRRFDRAGYV